MRKTTLRNSVKDLRKVVLGDSPELLTRRYPSAPLLGPPHISKLSQDKSTQEFEILVHMKILTNSADQKHFSKSALAYSAAGVVGDSAGVMCATRRY